MTVKETHSKLNDLSYSKVKVQPYLVSNMLINEQKNSFINWNQNVMRQKLTFIKCKKKTI